MIEISKRSAAWWLGACLPAACAAALPALAAAPWVCRSMSGPSRPFREKCAACHGAGAPQAGLDLRTGGDLLQGGHGGPPVAPGSPEKSLLYRLLADGRMPKGGGKLTPPELAKVATWIRTGARITAGPRGHWASRYWCCPDLVAQSESPTPSAFRGIEFEGLSVLPGRGVGLGRSWTT